MSSRQLDRFAAVWRLTSPALRLLRCPRSAARHHPRMTLWVQFGTGMACIRQMPRGPAYSIRRTVKHCTWPSSLYTYPTWPCRYRLTRHSSRAGRGRRSQRWRDPSDGADGDQAQERPVDVHRRQSPSTQVVNLPAGRLLNTVGPADTSADHVSLRRFRLRTVPVATWPLSLGPGDAADPSADRRAPLCATPEQIKSGTS